MGPSLEVLWEPELLPPARYPGDHKGPPDFHRSHEQERRWQELLTSAEVLFGFPDDSATELGRLLKSSSTARWVQAMAAGAGEQLRAAQLQPAALERVIITTASGVHAIPLAEFCLLGLLAFTKNLPRMLEDRSARRWDEYPSRELTGQTLVILGLGAIGGEVARLARAFGMRVIGVNRRGATDSEHVERMVPMKELANVLPQVDALVVALPLTDETRGMIDARALRSLKPGAVLVNVGRGQVIDEGAMIESLRSGRLGGAALDVTAAEPLPPDSPLWELPNVLLSPHTAALSFRENERIVDLFLENCRRYLDGQELINRIDPGRFY